MRKSSLNFMLPGFRTLLTLNIRSMLNDSDITNVIGDLREVPDAGLILLHPFLRQLFLRLNLLDSGKPESIKDKSKAVLLLNYLADGKAEIKEHRLLSNLLVGVSQLEVTSNFVDLTEEELLECDNLLLEVIKHWTAIKNCSIGGLRESFLMRKGLLKQKNLELTIVIERKSIDILIEKLPWSLYVIQLPWLDHPIFTEWY